MSGIALVLAERGVRVTGSDLKGPATPARLRAPASRWPSVTPPRTWATRRSSWSPRPYLRRNPELAEARARGLEVWPRAKMLAHLAEERQTIAVAGTHGKTSTSSMIATMLSRMGLEPTFLIGGEIDGFDANAASGSGEHYVVEADESDGSFVYLDPVRLCDHQRRGRPPRSLRLPRADREHLRRFHGAHRRRRHADRVRRRRAPGRDRRK